MPQFLSFEDNYYNLDTIISARVTNKLITLTFPLHGTSGTHQSSTVVTINRDWDEDNYAKMIAWLETNAVVDLENVAEKREEAERERFRSIITRRLGDKAKYLPDYLDELEEEEKKL